MKCPHCLVEFHDNVEKIQTGFDFEGNYEINKRSCPSCKRVVLQLIQYKYIDLIGTPHNTFRTDIIVQLIRPKKPNRATCPLEVPSSIASDYSEACLVLEDSPKASAALSRRCLQNIIHEHLGITKRNLYLEIQEVIDNKLFPSDVTESIDAIRHIGNFAAHPIKSTSSGEIVEVEPHEADWNLEVLEMIFDHLFVRPEIVRKKKEVLNKKLKDAGKPEM
jgi:hypothetical protein